MIFHFLDTHCLFADQLCQLPRERNEEDPDLVDGRWPKILDYVISHRSMDQRSFGVDLARIVLFVPQLNAVDEL